MNLCITNTQTEIYSLQRSGDGVLLSKCVYLMRVNILLYFIYVHYVY